jgi:hypothetical protein
MARLQRIKAESQSLLQKLEAAVTAADDPFTFGN